MAPVTEIPTGGNSRFKVRVTVTEINWNYLFNGTKEIL